MVFGNCTVDAGKALPFGSTVTEEGVNFALFSRHAASVSLILFESSAPDSPWVEIPLTKRGNRTGDIWHCLVRNLKAGACYLYRVGGPYVPERGLRFNSHKFLLDPYARALTDLRSWNLGESLGYDPDAPGGDLSYSYR